MSFSHWLDCIIKEKSLWCSLREPKPAQRSETRQKGTLKVASIALTIGGTPINATAFVSGSYLVKYSSGDQNSAEEEKKGHDLTVEKY